MSLPEQTQLAAGHMLRAVREALNLTVEDAAKRIGISKSSLSAYEHGQRAISGDHYHAIIAFISGEMLSHREPGQ